MVMRPFFLAPLLATAAIAVAPTAVFAQPAAPDPGPPATTPADPAANRAPGRKAELDNLLNALKVAPSDEAAAALEERIKGIWLSAASPAASLLIKRGMRDLHSDASGEAVADFDAVLALDPELPAGYEFRAAARFGTGDYVGAIRDIEATLKRDPRRFTAFQLLSRIAEARGDQKGALLAWQKALELDPKMPDAQKRLRELNRKVNGENT